jgi:hypothetical protein
VACIYFERGEVNFKMDFITIQGRDFCWEQKTFDERRI